MKKGAPPEPSASGAGGERTSIRMSELFRLRGSERYGDCEDDGPVGEEKLP